MMEEYIKYFTGWTDGIFFSFVVKNNLEKFALLILNVVAFYKMILASNKPENKHLYSA